MKNTPEACLYGALSGKEQEKSSSYYTQERQEKHTLFNERRKQEPDVRVFFKKLWPQSGLALMEALPRTFSMSRSMSKLVSISVRKARGVAFLMKQCHVYQSPRNTYLSDNVLALWYTEMVKYLFDAMICIFSTGVERDVYAAFQEILAQKR